MIVDTNRRFVKDEELTKLGKNGKAVAYRFFLFNNLLIYASPGSPFQKKYKVHRCLNLGLCKIEDIKDPNDSPLLALHAFVIKNPQKEITISCNSADQKSSWIQDLTKAIQETVDRQKKRLQDSEVGFFEPSVSKSKTPGNPIQIHMGKTSFQSVDQIILQLLGEPHESPKCRLCLRYFGRFSSRKYICPSCKNNVCTDCASRQAEAMDEISSESQTVKICDACFGILSGSVTLE
jgi:hypothetical protein